MNGSESVFRMINVTQQILYFRQFLLNSWKDLDLLMDNHDWEDDGRFTSEWLQVNWEFLVERQLLKKQGFLNAYAMHFVPFRVLDTEVKTTHQILVVPKANRILRDEKTGLKMPINARLVFYVFLHKMDGGGYGLYPPFDYAIVAFGAKKTFYHIPVDDVEFFMDNIQNRQNDDHGDYLPPNWREEPQLAWYQQDYNIRQLKLMLAKIRCLRQQPEYLVQLIGDLKGLLDCLEHAEPSWIQPFILYWGDLEVIYACALDRESHQLSDEECKEINASLDWLEDYIKMTVS